MTARLPGELLRSGLALLMTWMALWAWRGFVEDGGSFIYPVLAASVLVVVPGALTRSARIAWPAVLTGQVLIAVAWLNHQLHTGGRLGEWLPTVDSLRHLASSVRTGAADLNALPAPVPADHPQVVGYLIALGLMVMIGTDLLARGLGHPVWAGLPLAAVLAVPILVLTPHQPWPVVAAVAACYLALLAAERIDRTHAWARVGATGADPVSDTVDNEIDAGAAWMSAARLAGTAIVVGLVAGTVLPVSARSSPGALGLGTGPGALHQVNPVIDLHGNLLRRSHTPLLYARTDAADTGYVRLTVLDEFDGNRWSPSVRVLPTANTADGLLPRAPGLGIAVETRTSQWSFRLPASTNSAWLPTPYPVQSIRIDRGDWRFDSRTLDISLADGRPRQDVHYQLTALDPRYDPTLLARASRDPAGTASTAGMTLLPPFVPPVLVNTARRVTASAANDYERAILLQNWFRRDGGFRYSLRSPAGSGLGQLANFVSNHRSGYCEQFAAAMAVMARALGMPARISVGFLRGHPEPNGTLVYTSDDLHAWPEIYFRGSGWVRFEPTPGGRTGAAPAWTSQNAPGDPGQPTPTPTSVPTTPATPITPDLGTGSGSSGRSPVALALGTLAVMVALALLAAPATVRSQRRRRRVRTVTPSGAAAEALWAELIDVADDLGPPIPSGLSVRESGRALAERARPDATGRADLDELVTAVEQARYAPPGSTVELREETRRRMLTRWPESMRAGYRSRDRWLARVLPRSLWRSGEDGTAD